jgi:CelD/BcsL family acetyltransferase involved in cellulose biosynthesis
VIRLVVAQTPYEIDALQPAWEQLFSQQEEATLFQSFRWNRLAVEFFSHERPNVVLVESDSGAALIPAAIRNGSQLSLLGEELFDYRDVLCVGDAATLAYAWRTLAELRLPLAMTSFCEGGALERWNEFQITDFCKAPCVGPGISADEFASSHPRSARQLRRLAGAGVALARYGGENHRLLREIYSRKATLSNGCGNLFADSNRIDFMLAVAGDVPAQCQIFTLETTSTLVAALVTFRDGNVRRCYTTYFNPGWAHYSPGIALLFEATRLSLAEGLTCDYMTGEQDYKLRLATGSVQLYRAQGKLLQSGIREREVSLAACD